MTTGIFTGSFNPFTIGHDAIVKRALRMMDRIIIGVGTNRQKNNELSADERVNQINKVYTNNQRVEVKAYSGLSVDFAITEQATCFVKGVRSVKDFEYEREQAELNRRLSGIDTILLIAEPEYSGISSSLVRELMSFGRDVSEFLPNPKINNE
jgi:hypothetical protein